MMEPDIEEGEYDADTGSPCEVRESALPKQQSSMRILPAGPKTMCQSMFGEVLCTSVDNTRLVIRDGRIVRIFEFPDVGACTQVGKDISVHPIDPEHISISGDGRTIATSSLHDKEVYVKAKIYRYRSDETDDQPDWYEFGDDIKMPIEHKTKSSISNFQTKLSFDGNALAFGFSYENKGGFTILYRAPRLGKSTWTTCKHHRHSHHYFQGGPPLSLSQGGGILACTDHSHNMSKTRRYLTNHPERKAYCGGKKNYPEERLPEMIDNSARGWATDYAVAIVGLCFFIASLDYREEYQHFRWMAAGTGFAHLFGGLSHHFFPNRASDGKGQVGFYICMALGYSANCLAYGFGWGLEGSLWKIISMIHVAYLVITAATCCVLMERTRQKVDDTPEGIIFYPDAAFRLGEGLVFVGHLTTSILYLVSQLGEKQESVYTWVTVLVNVLGWSIVYFIGPLGYLIAPHIADPAMMQLLFHYSMMVLLWAINMIATETSV